MCCDLKSSLKYKEIYVIPLCIINWSRPNKVLEEFFNSHEKSQIKYKFSPENMHNFDERRVPNN